MKFLEKLSLSQSTEYRIACSEEDLFVLAEGLLALLPIQTTSYSQALELAEILDQMESENFRRLRKLAHKLRKTAGKSK